MFPFRWWRAHDLRPGFHPLATGLIFGVNAPAEGFVPARGVDYRSASRRATISPVACGCSAVGSASPCQGEGRGFESRHPLEGAVASTPAVEWPSGEATACKAVHTGSIPVSTSECVPARLAQRESASLTRKRSLVQSQYRAPFSCEIRPGFAGPSSSPRNSGWRRRTFTQGDTNDAPHRLPRCRQPCRSRATGYQFREITHLKPDLAHVCRLVVSVAS